ncbi:hypothetical protein LX32DRAFT_5022 [Colletotrichum zoysiae]|uniref:Uncharacterized protein n=1 Tax=Colletotrichum zoysiae TaxID=1216348 RepID=A0AAD9HT00_9PEZI|nr:hypothetical protein LX32DRAFT_5022 [Colletotrichum zoysiae]
MSAKRKKHNRQPKHHRAISWAAMASLSQGGLCRVLFRLAVKQRRKKLLRLRPFQIRPMNSGRTESQSSPEPSKMLLRGAYGGQPWEEHTMQPTEARDHQPMMRFSTYTANTWHFSPPKLSIHQDQRHGWTRKLLRNRQ